MKKLLLILMLLLTGCAGRYRFETTVSGVARFDTANGRIHVLTKDGWIELQDIPTIGEESWKK